MRNQTAVEWLIEQVKSKDNQKSFSILQWLKIIEKAKEIEREQILDAYHEGRTDQQSPIDKWYNREKEDYYNQTYGGDK